MSLRLPAWRPVSKSILADPSIVCAPRRVATSLGSPILTPASARASSITNMYAGPLPLKPVTASIIDSGTSMALPTALKIARALSISSCPAPEPRQTALALSPTRAGVLGITRITATFSPAADSKSPVVSPAAMDISSWPGLNTPAMSRTTGRATPGFKAIMRISAVAASSLLSVTIFTFSEYFKCSSLSLFTSETYIFPKATLPLPASPVRIAPAMAPPPRKPIFKPVRGIKNSSPIIAGMFRKNYFIQEKRPRSFS